MERNKQLTLIRKKKIITNKTIRNLFNHKNISFTNFKIFIVDNDNNIEISLNDINNSNIINEKFVKFVAYVYGDNFPIATINAHIDDIGNILFF